MKPVYIVICMLLVFAVFAVWISRPQVAEPALAGTEPELPKPLEHPVLPVEPVRLSNVVVEAEHPVLEEAPVRPVDSIEERGDAMLFEIDALQSTPFDSAITQPFD